MGEDGLSSSERTCQAGAVGGDPADRRASSDRSSSGKAPAPRTSRSQRSRGRSQGMLANRSLTTGEGPDDGSATSFDGLADDPLPSVSRHGADLAPVGAPRLEVVDVEPTRLEGELGGANQFPVAVGPEPVDADLGPRPVEPLEGPRDRARGVVPVEEEGSRVPGKPHEDVVAVARGKVAETLVVGGYRDLGQRAEAHAVLALGALGHGVRRQACRLLSADPRDEVAVGVEPLDARRPRWKLAARALARGGCLGWGLGGLPGGRSRGGLGGLPGGGLRGALLRRRLRLRPGGDRLRPGGDRLPRLFRVHGACR